MTPLVLDRLVAARAQRQAIVHGTWLDDNGQFLHEEGDPTPADLADPIAERLRSGKSGIEVVDGREVFLNVHLPSPRLVLIGAVHISQALARIAQLIGFEVLVVDPRTAFATPERFDGLRVIAEWPDEVDMGLDRYSALAALTHDPKIDDAPLRAALQAECFYVGALGSRKTHGKRLERLKAAGSNDADLQRVKAPIGLDIGAASPAEIAVAIAAEIVAALRR